MSHRFRATWCTSQDLNLIATHAVDGDEISDLINAAKRRPGPLHGHGSGAVLGKHAFDLLVGSELAGVGFLHAFVDVTNLPGLPLHVAGQGVDGQ